MLLVLVACRSAVPLGDVPIRGGTRAERELVRSELDAWDEAVGPGRVELRGVELVAEVRGRTDLGGAYRGNRTLQLLEGQDSPGTTTRHELCHALDDAEDLSAETLFDRLADAVFAASPTLSALGADLYPTPEDRRGEVAEVAQRLVEDVYRAYDAPLPLVLDPTDAVTFAGPVVPAPQVDPTVDPEVVRVRADPDWEDLVLYADVHTGAVVTEAPEVVEDACSPTIRGVFVADLAGSQNGPAAVLGQIYAFELDPGPLRLFVSDGSAWRQADQGCAEPEYAQVFAADGRVREAWVEDGRVRWLALD